VRNFIINQQLSRNRSVSPYGNFYKVIISLAFVLIITACSSNQIKLTGIWQAEFEAVPNLKADFDFELRHDLFSDKWSGGFEIAELMVKAPLTEVSIKDSKIVLNLGNGADFKGNISEDKTVIAGVLTTPNRKPQTLHFTKATKWSSQVPARVDKNKQNIKKWAYMLPKTIDDGWKVSSLNKTTSESKSLNELFQKIVDGKYQGLDALLVAQNGKLVLEEYFYLGGREKIHSIQSATKSVTSLLLGIAHDDGLIKDLDAPLKNFFPAYPDSVKRTPASVTLRHALTMSAGLDWLENIPYSDPKNDALRMNQSKDMYQYVLSKNADPKNRPGQKFEYNSGLSVLLGGVILDVTGKPADKYAEQTLFKQLGIKKFWWERANGQIHTGGGLFMRPRDIMKLGQLVLDEGKWNGEQVISKSWISESTAYRLPISELNKQAGYGYQWWRGTCTIDKKILPVIYAAGYGGQVLYIVPDLNLVVLTLHHNPSEADLSHSIAWSELEKMIIPAFLPDI